MRRTRVLLVLLAVLAAAVWVQGTFTRAQEETPEQPAPAPGKAFGAPSDGCLSCHKGIEAMHDTVEITCVGCHGGDGSAVTKEEAHVRADDPGPWTSSANPKNSFAALNKLPADFIRFINPGDLRIAHMTCGQARCHATEVATTRTSIMGHNAMAHNAVFYNNGAIDSKVPTYGESFLANGAPGHMVDNPSAAETIRSGSSRRRAIPSAPSSAATTPPASAGPELTGRSPASSSTC